MHLDITADDTTREVLLKQLELRQFSLDEDVELSVVPSTVFEGRYEVLADDFPLMLLAKNLESVSLDQELKRASHLLISKFLKVLDKKKLKSKQTSAMGKTLDNAYNLLNTTVETLPKKFGEYKIKSAFIEELRGDKADFILEVVVEESEFHSLADCFKEKVISQVDKKNYAVKPFIEFLNALSAVNSESKDEEEKAAFHVKSLIELLLKNNLNKIRLYESGELRGVNQRVLTTDFDYALLNDPLRIALQGIYSNTWKGPLWGEIESKSYGSEDLDAFMKRLNGEQKKTCQVYYYKYTQPHLWETTYKQKYESMKNKGLIEKYYLEDISSAKDLNKPLFLKFVNVDLR